MGMPFSTWSIRKLAQYLATTKTGRIAVSRERPRQILVEEDVTFQRTKTWKESPDPLREEKLARIEWLLEHERETTFAFDEFGPLAVMAEGGSCWARGPVHSACGSIATSPTGRGSCSPGTRSEVTASLGASSGGREPHRPCGRSRPSGPRVPDDRSVHVILDNLNHHRGPALRQWCEANDVELAFTPTYGSWANPIEAHFGPLRLFTIVNSDHQSHAELATPIRSYIRSRNSDTRDPGPRALAPGHDPRRGPSPLGSTSSPIGRAFARTTSARPMKGTARLDVASDIPLSLPRTVRFRHPGVPSPDAGSPGSGRRPGSFTRRSSRGWRGSRPVE
jgi:hypothetical protein